MRPSAKHFAGLFQGVDKNRLRFLESPPAAAAAAGDVEVDDAETVEVEPMEVVDGREAVAHLRNLRGSPNKVRRVLDAIRGLSYEEALMALEFMPYRACDDILKVLYSVSSYFADRCLGPQADFFSFSFYLDILNLVNVIFIHGRLLQMRRTTWG